MISRRALLTGAAAVAIAPALPASSVVAVDLAPKPDVMAFARLLGVDLYPWQIEVLELLQANPHRVTIMMPRNCGRTLLRRLRAEA